MPLSLLALAAGAFGIGTTEFIIMGLLTQVGADVGISIPTAGTLISGYAIGVGGGRAAADHRHAPLAAQAAADGADAHLHRRQRRRRAGAWLRLATAG